jgi:hypothetical protein
MVATAACRRQLQATLGFGAGAEGSAPGKRRGLLQQAPERAATLVDLEELDRDAVA